MASKKIHSKKDISRHLTLCKKGNLTVSEYCKEQGIPPSTFYNWRKRTGINKTAGSRLPGRKFARLTLSPPSPSSYAYEIMKKDFTIRFPGDFDSSVLRRIIEVLS